MVSILGALALVSLYFVVNDNVNLGIWFMLCAILLSTVYDRLSRKRRTRPYNRKKKEM